MLNERAKELITGGKVVSIQEDPFVIEVETDKGEIISVKAEHYPDENEMDVTAQKKIVSYENL